MDHGRRKTRLGRAGIVIACFALLFGAFGTSIALREPPPGTVVASLEPGQHTFWAGPLVDNSWYLVGDRGRARVCDENVSELQSGVPPFNGAERLCFDWFLDVAAGGDRLRVAANVPWSGESRFDLAIYGPDCTIDDPLCPENLTKRDGGRQTFSPEAFVPKPDPGRYQVVVWASNVRDTAFDMRAKLEEPAKPQVREVPPDMRPEPPFDLGLRPPGDCNRSNVDEVFEDRTQPERCLRFTFGYGNGGRGAYDIRFDRSQLDPTTLEGPATQRVYSSDGSFRERAAGTAEFHDSHAHFHYAGLWLVELFRVDAATGELGPVLGKNVKEGACGHDWKMVNFRVFNQQPAGAYDSDDGCGTGIATAPDVPTHSVHGLSAGWADVYFSNFPDNFVDFGNGTDGFYLLRLTIDKANNIQETDDGNNVGYTYMEVTNTSGSGVVRVVERGYGSSPWDAGKEVLPSRP